MTKPETPATAVVRIDRIRQAARVLDSAIPIPGTKYSFGIDAVIGLVPGLGDAVGVVFASVILYQAFRLGASKRLLTRMLYNIGVDATGRDCTGQRLVPCGRPGRGRRDGGGSHFRRRVDDSVVAWALLEKLEIGGRTLANFQFPISR